VSSQTAVPAIGPPFLFECCNAQNTIGLIRTRAAVGVAEEQQVMDFPKFNM